MYIDVRLAFSYLNLLLQLLSHMGIYFTTVMNVFFKNNKNSYIFKLNEKNISIKYTIE